MGTETSSKNWGAMGIASVSGGIGLNVAGTVYVLNNFDNSDKFLFALADLGIGGSLGFDTKKVKDLVVKVLQKASASHIDSYTRLPVKREFSASDLNLARGAEATASASLIAGYSATVIAGFPWTISAPKPGEVMDNDYFSDANVSGWQMGIGIGAAYRFYGMWFKLWSFQ